MTVQQEVERLPVIERLVAVGDAENERAEQPQRQQAQERGPKPHAGESQKGWSGLGNTFYILQLANQASELAEEALVFLDLPFVPELLYI